MTNHRKPGRPRLPDRKRKVPISVRIDPVLLDRIHETPLSNGEFVELACRAYLRRHFS